MSDNRERGLYGKYKVERVDGKGIGPHGCLVLELDDDCTHDAAATWADRLEWEGLDEFPKEIRAVLCDAAVGRPDISEERVLRHAVAHLAAIVASHRDETDEDWEDAGEIASHAVKDQRNRLVNGGVAADVEEIAERLYGEAP